MHDQEQQRATETVVAEVAAEASSPNGGNPVPETPEQKAEHSPAETRDSSQLFEFSRFIHVGPGADSCPDGEDGSCSENHHVHMWIRLPNPFQHTSIREKAMAAKARRLRLLRDPESDARTIIEGAIEEVVAHGDRDALIDEIANKDFLEDHLRATRNVQDEEEFEHIEEDQERLRALRAMDPDQRPAEEVGELETHCAKFTERVNEERGKIQDPIRESVAEKTLDELVQIVREDRIQRDAQAMFNETYSRWEWYVACLKPRDPMKGLPNERYFASIDQLRDCAPEVYNALDYHFTHLEAAQGRALKAS